MGQKVLVTGGAGYIGAHTVAELIEAGHEVVIVDNFSKSDDTLLKGLEKLTGRKMNFHQGDCTDVSFLKKVFTGQGPFDAVLHFAAYKSVGESVEQPLMYYRNNVDSLLAVLEVMKETGVRDLIFSSSCTVYGQPDRIPVDESAPFKRAESPYGATKQICERILEDVYKEGFRVVSLRYFNPIGAHPSGMIGELPIGPPNNLVPYITQTAAGIREKVTVFGGDYNTPDGTCIRDYIHVSDVAVAHLRAMDYIREVNSDMMLEAFNLGTGAGVSVLEMIETVMKAAKRPIPYAIGSRRVGDVESVYANAGKAKIVLGWQTRYTIQDSALHAWLWQAKIAKLNDLIN